MVVVVVLVVAELRSTTVLVLDLLACESGDVIVFVCFEFGVVALIGNEEVPPLLLPVFMLIGFD